MLHYKAKIVAPIVAASAMALLGACGQSGTGKTNDAPSSAAPEEKPAALAPVTLTLFSGTAGTMNEEQFVKYVKEPVSKKYPHITLNFVLSGNGTKIEDLITTGQIPDLLVNGPASIFTYKDLALAEDVTPLANQHQFDLNRIEKSVINFIKAYSDNDGLYTLPFMNGSPVLFYNKDIFDKFGTAYPKDFMTWDQILEIGKKVTRTDGGVQYRAMEFFALPSYNQLSATFINPATTRASFNTPEWKRLYETWSSFYRIPGSEFITTTYADIEKWFLKDRTLAMLTSPFNNPFNGISAHEETAKTFNWDIVTMPVYPDKPKTGSSDIPNHVMITKTSKAKDDAFRVVETILSDEVQSMMSRGGIVPVLTKQSVKDEFLKDIEFARGKNASAVFKLERAPARIPNEYDGAVQALLTTAMRDIYPGKKDVNTALRDIDEEANKRIETEKAKKTK